MSGGRPFRGKYLVRDRTAALYLRGLDALLRALARRRDERIPSAQDRPPRIVVGIGGHLGDTVLATHVLASIRASFPEGEIGVVAPSWGTDALTGHPHIERVHIVDHWKLNRSRTNFASRLQRSLASHGRALRELRAVGYDLALDLYPYYPNLSVIFHRAGIPVRVGFESGGGGSLFTQALSRPAAGQHITAAHRDVLAAAGIRCETAVRYDLPPLTKADEDAASLLLAVPPVDAAYAVIHPGTGDERKTWRLAEWVSLARGLRDRGLRVIITGSGAKEAAVADEIRSRVPEAVSLSGQTTIGALRYILRHAHSVFGIDSAAAHLAAAENARCVVLMADMTDSAAWRPLSERAVLRPLRSDAESLLAIIDSE